MSSSSSEDSPSTRNEVNRSVENIINEVTSVMEREEAAVAIIDMAQLEIVQHVTVTPAPEISLSSFVTPAAQQVVVSSSSSLQPPILQSEHPQSQESNHSDMENKVSDQNILGNEQCIAAAGFIVNSIQSIYSAIDAMTQALGATQLETFLSLAIRRNEWLALMIYYNIQTSGSSSSSSSDVDYSGLYQHLLGNIGQFRPENEYLFNVCQDGHQREMLSRIVDVYISQLKRVGELLRKSLLNEGIDLNRC